MGGNHRAGSEAPEEETATGEGIVGKRSKFDAGIGTRLP